MQLLHRALARVLASLMLLAAPAVFAQQGNTIRLGQTLPQTHQRVEEFAVLSFQSLSL